MSPSFAAAWIALVLTPALGQTPGQPPLVTRAPEPAPELTKFDLEFSGGQPRQLVGAIQKALGKPLNAIVPDEFADTKLPELKLKNVNVRELFSALEATSHKSEAYVSGTYCAGGYAGGPSQSYQVSKTSYGFMTRGVPSDDSIWYFYVEKPAFPPLSQPSKVCRFYSLAPYRERGATVEDITTAIQTGWKMLGNKDTPAISFHQDTKLLIAVGEASKLETIDAVLTALAPGLAGGVGISLPPPPGKETKAKPPVEKKSEK